jgi:hypothetical protein
MFTYLSNLLAKYDPIRKGKTTVCKKKVSGFPVRSRDVTNQTLPGRE